MEVWKFEPGQNLEGFELPPLIVLSVMSVMLCDVPTLVFLFLAHNYLKSFDLHTIKCLLLINSITVKRIQNMCMLLFNHQGIVKIAHRHNTRT